MIFAQLMNSRKISLILKYLRIIIIITENVYKLLAGTCIAYTIIINKLNII